jgi:hypothetical protein
MHVVGRPGPLQEFYRRLLVGKGAQKARVARKLSKAVFWILSMSRFYRKLGPCLAPQGQASSEAYVAGGERRGCDAPGCLAYGTCCPRAGTGVSLGALVATHLMSQRGRWTCRPERDLTRPLP